MKIIYGTNNKEKLKQVKEFFEYKQENVEFVSLKEIGFNEDIEENGKTFEENSYIKAKAIKEFCDKKGIKDIIIADDAGLCVDALNGQPGVYSARYVGNHAPQDITIKKLLDNMKDVKEPNRTAKFVCVLTAILPNGEKLVVEGETKGKIAYKPRTLGKLTYGPIFIPEGFEKTMNELTQEELGQTHREKAFIKLIEKLKEDFLKI